MITITNYYHQHILIINHFDYNSTTMECYYHAGETLHNFCIRKQCSLPLCARCIRVHLNQTGTHNLVSLNQVFEMVDEQLTTAKSALAHESTILTQDYSPELLIKEYSTSIEKDRQQALEKVNRRYDQLHNEFLLAIKSTYQKHFGALLPTINKSIKRLEEYSMTDESTKLQTTIKVLANDEIKKIQDLLATLETAKGLFNKNIPSLQMTEVRFCQPQINAHYSHSLQTSAAGDRIAFLQAQLTSLRAS